MTIGQANDTQLSFIKEVTPGTTPATPALQILRFTSETLQQNNTTTQSQEITSDRNIPDLILTDQANSGDISAELSGTTFDDLMEGALFTDATWSTDTDTGITFAADASGFTDSANGFISAGLEVGQFFEITGFADSTIDGFYRALTVAAGVVTTSPVPPATETAGASVTWIGSTIKSGKTDHSFTFQKQFKDLAAPAFQNFRGCRISTMGMTLTIGQIVDISFGIMGMTSEVSTTQISGATETAKTTKEVMNAVTNLTSVIATNDSDVTTVLKFTDLTLSFDNALRELKAIGTLGSIDVRAGTIQATASINPYFEDIQLMNAFLANTSFTLSWHLASDDGYDYIFSMPNVKITTQTIAARSRDTDMIVNSEVQAILDTGSNTSMRIDRFVP